MSETNQHPIAKQATEWAGGVRPLARRIGCSHTTISMWLNNKAVLDAEWALLLQKISKGKFKARDIRPELFEERRKKGTSGGASSEQA